MNYGLRRALAARRELSLVLLCLLLGGVVEASAHSGPGAATDNDPSAGTFGAVPPEVQAAEASAAGTLRQPEQRPRESEAARGQDGDTRVQPGNTQESAEQAPGQRTDQSPEQDTAQTPDESTEQAPEQDTAQETEPTPATEDQAGAIGVSLVQVAVRDGDRVERLGVGIAVADGLILTAAHLVEDEDLVLAIPFTTRNQLVADVVGADERLDLALLAVSGLTLDPVEFAQDGFEPGRTVRSAGIWAPSGRPVLLTQASGDSALQLSQGAVGAVQRHPLRRGSPALDLIEHNAMIPAAGYGGPLLNECGEVAGLNRGDPDLSVRQLRREGNPDGVVHAVRPTEVVAFVRAHGIEPAISEGSCESAVAVARAEAAETAEQLQERNQELETAAGQMEQTQEQLEQAEQDQDQVTAQLGDAQSRVAALEEQYESAVRAGAAESDSLRAELEAAREEEEALREQEEAARASVTTLESEVLMLRERQAAEAAASRTRLAIVATAAGLIALFAIAAFVSYRRRSRELAQVRQDAIHAQQQAAAAATPSPAVHFPSCRITGRTGDGHAVSIKIPGALLADGGAVIGRSPRNATFVIDDGTLSRRHARLFGEADSIYIEDLGTTNGTRVNGNVLDPRKARAVAEGDTIELGAVRMEFTVDS